MSRQLYTLHKPVFLDDAERDPKRMKQDPSNRNTPVHTRIPSRATHLEFSSEPQTKRTLKLKDQSTAHTTSPTKSTPPLKTLQIPSAARYQKSTPATPPQTPQNQPMRASNGAQIGRQHHDV